MSRPDPAKLRERLRARSLPKPPVPPKRELPRMDPARKAALVASQQEAASRAKAQLQARLDGVRQGRKDQEEKRRRPWWLLVVLLLLLLAILCCIGPCEPEVVPPVEEGTGEVEAVEPGEPVAPKPNFEGTVKPKPRPSFPAVAPKPVPWVASFRMQVAARSTRLAGCFVGTARPGVLRWTALVDPVTGRVTDHDLEPVLQSDQLTSDQRDCVLGVLEEPAYTIDAEGGASRVGMVIEF